MSAAASPLTSSTNHAAFVLAQLIRFALVTSERKSMTSIVPKAGKAGSSAVSPQLRALVELYQQESLSDYVLQLDSVGLETTKLWLRVLREVEGSYWRDSQQRLGTDDLLYVLESLINDATLRHRIVELYQSSKAKSQLPLLTE